METKRLDIQQESHPGIIKETQPASKIAKTKTARRFPIRQLGAETGFDVCLAGVFTRLRSDVSNSRSDRRTGAAFRD